MKMSLAIVLALLTPLAHAIFFPLNVSYTKMRFSSVDKVTEQDFQRLIEQTYVKYAPLARLHGSELVIERMWKDDRIFVTTDRDKKQWVIQVRGGSARVPGMTTEGFQYILCHDIGQHFAGFPFYPDAMWPSSEGQNAYFASQSCLRNLWRSQLSENAKYRATIDRYTQDRCDEIWSETADQNLCYRITAAAHNAMSRYAELRGFYPPQYDHADPFEVYETFFEAPKAQVRLDIALAGALCSVEFNEKIIPGIASSPDRHNGIEAERDAARYSCHPGNGMIDGIRPISWFLPSYDYPYVKFQNARIAEVNGNGNGVVEPGELGELVLGLNNASDQVTRNVQVAMSSRESFIATTRSMTNYPDLEPGRGTEYGKEKLFFKVAPEATCGAPFSLRVAAKNDHGIANFKRKFYVGSFETEVVGKVDQRIEIKPFTIIHSQLNIGTEGPVTKAEVAIDIHHDYIRSVKFYLIAPDGTEKFLANHPATMDDEAQFTETIDIPVAQAQGKWTLKIVDDQAVSKGYLRSWKLTLHKPKCQ